jgi:hypothetical protein
MLQQRSWLVAAFVSLAATTVSHARTDWWVDVSAAPGGDGSQLMPFQRIQQGIDAATHGDTVRVMPGTYFENIHFQTKSITVASTAGPNATTISGDGTRSVVHMRGVSPMLDGFTVQNGGGSFATGGFSTYGGGVFLEDTTAAALVRNCVVRNNYALSGDGVAAFNGAGLVLGCKIEDNGGSSYPGWCQTNDSGGGAYGPTGLVLRECALRRNAATLRGGGAFGCTLINCVVEANYAAEGAGLSNSVARFTRIEQNTAWSCDQGFTAAGGADACTLEDCQLIGNTVWDEAGGARNSTLTRCTVRDNSVTTAGFYGAIGGGALNCTATDCWFEGNWVYSSPVYVGRGGGMNGGSALRCVFVDNAGYFGAGAYGTSLDCCTLVLNQGEGANNSAVANSILWFNLGGAGSNFGTVAYSNVQGGWPGTGNIDADPQFWNAGGGDFRLMPSSPCIDNADPARFDPDGTRLDMGARPYSASDCLGAVVYCPPAYSGDLLCNPQIAVAGTPSVSASSGFAISATQVPAQRMGLIFFGLSGETQVPWSASNVCVAGPRRRTGAHMSGGSFGTCDGVLGIDFNAWLAANGNPLAFGTIVWAQAWYRDPTAAQGTSFSNAVRFSMCP